MTPEQFIARLGNPEHQFAETLAFIDATFEHQPTAFDNGPVHNSAEQNQGSCKVLAMSLDLGLSDEQADSRLTRFRRHDEQVLAAQHAVYDDAAAVMQTARQARADLENLFDTDRIEARSVADMIEQAKQQS